MIICLQTRSGELHYISWTSFRNDIHYTMCGKTFSNKRDKVITYGIDNSIPEACPNCRSAVEASFQDIRTDRGSLLENSKGKYLFIQIDYFTPQDKYENLLDLHVQPKLSRMMRKKKIK